MSGTRHERWCREVLQARGIADFERQVVDFAHHLGFETVGAMVVTQHSSSLAEIQTITNAPAAHMNEFSDPAHSRLDPVLHYFKRSAAPFVRDRRRYAGTELQRLWQRPGDRRPCPFQRPSQPPAGHFNTDPTARKGRRQMHAIRSYLIDGLKKSGQPLNMRRTKCILETAR